MHGRGGEIPKVIRDGDTWEIIVFKVGVDAFNIFECIHTSCIRLCRLFPNVKMHVPEVSLELLLQRGGVVGSRSGEGGG